MKHVSIPILIPILGLVLFILAILLSSFLWRGYSDFRERLEEAQRALSEARNNLIETERELERARGNIANASRAIDGSEERVAEKPKACW